MNSTSTLHIASTIQDIPSTLPSARAAPLTLDSRSGRLVKRALDVSAALLLVAILAPLMLCIAALIRAGGGPALYRHRRIGAGGRPFGCLKFRSMAVDGDRILAELMARDLEAAEEWARTRKLRDDPRVTAIGRVLRTSSLDELPQLFNVLRGDMSMVGPRPIVAAELRHYGEHAEDYMRTRPGITGLWQVSGRSDAAYEQRVRLDVEYVRTWSLARDASILARTVPAVLVRRGAV